MHWAVMIAQPRVTLLASLGVVQKRLDGRHIGLDRIDKQATANRFRNATTGAANGDATFCRRLQEAQPQTFRRLRL